MDFDTMKASIREAKRTMEVADAVAEDIAYLLIGRLRKVNSGTALRALKKEIANYDMTTGRWKP